MIKFDVFTPTFLEKALIPYVVAGYPDMKRSEKILMDMIAAEVDAIEIAVPFSDPTAEEPKIQTACGKALAKKITTDDVFEMVSRVRKNSKTQIPIIFVCYANLILSRGIDNFMKKCKDCGVTGLIITDVPYEERDEFYTSCKENGIYMILSVTATSEGRIEKIAAAAEGYLKVFAPDIESARKTVETVRKTSKIPCVIHLGSLKREEAKEISRFCNGVVLDEIIIDRTDDNSDWSMFIYGNKRNLNG